MNGSTENRAPGASEKPGRRDVILTITVAQSMLPLVRRIVTDIVEIEQSLTRLRPEQDRLDRKRRSLDWPERQRRYQVHEQILAAERHQLEAIAELAGLGVTLIDASKGQVGFPTRVNDRRAFFSWKSGEDSLRYWHFNGEDVRRTIPAHWLEENTQRAHSKA